ncbi:NAD(P)H-hydrate dehydratase [Methanolobus sediminis]|uniref:Bifunctional NAD(P)H-hydrate repair enzyme n=1 Tax=Methanolobus sediminis TaxID=3072978 RepID=A0AA51UQA5_9EURY|nr:NAD(P)H-hydrate dehydratase [Methanolobus sediminis]WMW26300.1 NAD(P)H-hydrate dehydratase [Methanolobus sediminis]
MSSITSSKMRAIDANCTYLGLSPVQLMENAGAAIAREIMSKISSGKVLFVAGRGNNGGDAFVAARHLATNTNYEVRLILLGHSSRIRTEESKQNFSLLSYSGLTELKEIADSKELEKYSGWKDNDIIVDGVLGSGIKGAPREPESTAIALINSSNSFIISIDSPSGYDLDGGEVVKSVIADMTITFHRMKTGLELPGSEKYSGLVKVAPIGVCRDAEEYVGMGDLMSLSRRNRDAHKGNSGRVLIIGGGAYYGAPALAALAALRTGADIVTVAVPENVADTVASFSPNLIVIPLKGDRLNPSNIPVLKNLLETHDVAVIGPGLGREKETLETVEQLLPLCRKAVVDADALFELKLPIKSEGKFILTPHSAEFSRLYGSEIPEELDSKKNVVSSFASDNDVTVVMKGKVDVISDGSVARLNRTGNAGMTVGGTGDVLTGITGALFAVNDAMDAASCAVFISGAAGDLAFKNKGNGLLATDIIARITDVILGVL